MTDEQFDDVAKQALTFEAGPPSEAVWNRVKPVRWSWLPTIREILVCGCVAGLALGAVGLGISRKHDSASKPNPVIQGAMHDETKSVLASVTRIAGLKQG